MSDNERANAALQEAAGRYHGIGVGLKRAETADERIERLKNELAKAEAQAQLDREREVNYEANYTRAERYLVALNECNEIIARTLGKQIR